MVKITEDEIRDINGKTRTVRKIDTPAYTRVTHTDGTTVEHYGITAKEWPWPKDSDKPEWRIYGLPREVFIQALQSKPIETIAFLASEHGETILELIKILPAITHSADTQTTLMGEEIPA